MTDQEIDDIAVFTARHFEHLLDFWQKCCRGKIRRTGVQAQPAAYRTRDMQAYQCIFCGWWHIGHAPEGSVPKHVTAYERNRQNRM